MTQDSSSESESIVTTRRFFNFGATTSSRSFRLGAVFERTLLFKSINVISSSDESSSSSIRMLFFFGWPFEDMETTGD